METDRGGQQAREALQKAYEAHRLPLLRLATLLVTEGQTAEDLVQDVFVRSASAVGALREDEVGPYLRRGVVNAWKNEVRHRRTVALAELKLVRGRGHQGTSLEDRDEIWMAIRRLPPRQRACLVLRYYEDLPDREVARLLGCRVGTVRSQSSRAIEKLRKVISP